MSVVTVTLIAMRKLPFSVDFPFEHGDFHSYVLLVHPIVDHPIADDPESTSGQAASELLQLLRQLQFQQQQLLLLWVGFLGIR